MLFECLAGERPFERESELAVVFAHLNEPPPRLTDARPELPAAWDGVVARALAKEPARAVRRPAARSPPRPRDALHGRAAPAAPIAAAARRRVAAALAVAAAAIGRCSRSRDDAPSPKPARRARPLVLSAVDADDAGGRSRASARARGSATGSAPPDVVVAGGSAWLLLPASSGSLRVDTRTHELTADQAAVVPLGGSPRATVRLGRRRTAARSSRASRPRPGGSERFRPGGSPSTGLAAGDGSLWVAERGRRRARSSPSNGRTGQSLPVRRQRQADVRRRRAVVARGSRRPPEARPGNGPRARADRPARRPSATSPSAAGSSGPRSSPTASSTGSTSATSACGARSRPAPTRERISFGGGRLWVANTAARAVTSLDPRSGARAAARRSARPRRPPRTATASSGPARCRRRRRCRRPAGPSCGCRFPATYLTLDPAVSHSTADEQLADATCADLLTYPDRTARAASSSARRSRPRCRAVSADGRTYTFRIRAGLPLLAAVERAGDGGDVQAHARARFLAEARRGGRGPSEAPAIVGLAAYLAGKAAARLRASGRSGDTLSITLARPSGDFLARLSLPHSARFR